MPNARIILPLLLLFIISCGNKQEETNPEIGRITGSVYATGVIKSVNEYEVFSSANGIVAEVLVREGDIVSKGDPILRLTNTTARLNTDIALLNAEYSSLAANRDKLRELSIAIDQAKVKMENDELLLKRQRNLWSQQIGSRNELDQRELAYKSSVNAYESAKLRYADLQKQINLQAKQTQKSAEISLSQSGDFTVRSEVQGKIYEIHRKKGEMVSTQMPVALVGDAANFLLELQVDEYDIARIKPGQAIMVTMDSYRDSVFEAVVSRILPIMNERSRSFTVEAEFRHPPPALYPNLSSEANIIIEVKEKALTIPRSYLVGNDSVILKNKEKRKVVTGLMDYQKVEILEGLHAEEIILKPE